MNYRRRPQILRVTSVFGRLEHVAQIEVGEEGLHRVLPDGHRMCVPSMGIQNNEHLPAVVELQDGLRRIHSQLLP